MLTLALVPLTCWLCALLAIPRRPRLGNEVEELAYARLLVQQRIALLALLLTGAALVALVASLPPRLDPGLEALRVARHACASPAREAPYCPIALSGGGWADADEPALPMH